MKLCRDLGGEEGNVPVTAPGHQEKDWKVMCQTTDLVLWSES